MQQQKRAAVFVALAVLVWACTSDSDDGGTGADSEEDSAVAVADRWTDVPPGPLNGWAPHVVIPGGPDSSTFFVLGLRRFHPNAEIDVRSPFHAFDTSTGEWRDLPSPPSEHELVDVVAVATETDVYVMAKDCQPTTISTALIVV